MAQIQDWEAWLEAHYCSLKETFGKYKRAGADLPAEFVTMDTSRLHYIVIAGRRMHFNDRTYRIQRKKRNDGGEWILHYDNLVDASQHVIGAATY